MTPEEYTRSVRPDLFETKSRFDELKITSQYHFDNTKHDKPGEWFHIHGRITGDWENELYTVSEASQPLNWRNLGTVFINTPLTPFRAARVDAFLLDVLRAGADPDKPIIHASTDIMKYPVFANMVRFFGLKGSMAKIHTQIPGQVFNQHLDNYSISYPGIPDDEIVRFIVMLTDWAPGHFYMYGTHSYTHWRAGDFHTFRWKDIPHSTANAGFSSRACLVITGIKTEKTEQILRSDYQDYPI